MKMEHTDVRITHPASCNLFLFDKVNNSLKFVVTALLQENYFHVKAMFWRLPFATPMG